MTTLTPAAVAAIKPFYVRDATEHSNLPGRFATFEEANESAVALRRRSPHTFLVRDRRAVRA